MLRLYQVITNVTVLTLPGVLAAYGLTVKNVPLIVAGAALLVLGAIFVHVIDQRLAAGHAVATLYTKLHISPQADLQCSLFTPGWVFRFFLKESARFPDSGRPRSRMLIYQGLAGRCYRTNKIVKVVTDDGDYVDRLVREFGFTEHDARQFPTDRVATLCVPIPNARKKVVGVLNLDAKTDIFTEDVIRRVEEELSLFFQVLQIL